MGVKIYIPYLLSKCIYIKRGLYLVAKAVRKSILRYSLKYIPPSCNSLLIKRARQIRIIVHLLFPTSKRSIIKIIIPIKSFITFENQVDYIANVI